MYAGAETGLKGGVKGSDLTVMGRTFRVVRRCGLCQVSVSAVEGNSAGGSFVGAGEVLQQPGERRGRKASQGEDRNESLTRLPDGKSCSLAPPVVAPLNRQDTPPKRVA